MLNLNLISQDLKKEIKFKRVCNLIKGINYIFISSAVLIAILLWGANYILLQNLSKITTQVSLTSIDNEETSEKIKEINNELDNITKIQEEFISYSLLLSDLSEKIPKNITLSQIKIDQDKKAVKIKGRAAFRSDLLKLKEALETSEMFVDINFPIQNILTKENIIFEINTGINFEALIKNQETF